MSDDLRNFCGEDEVWRSFGVPAFDGGEGGSAIEGVVEFDGGKFCGVVREIFGGFEAGGIEGAGPASGGEGGGADMDLRLCGHDECASRLD